MITTLIVLLGVAFVVGLFARPRFPAGTSALTTVLAVSVFAGLLAGVVSYLTGTRAPELVWTVLLWALIFPVGLAGSWLRAKSRTNIQ